MLHLCTNIFSKLEASICWKIYLCRKVISGQTERSRGQIQQRLGKWQSNFFPFWDLLSHFFHPALFFIWWRFSSWSKSNLYIYIFIYIKPHSILISLWFKMVFLQYKNLINTAWRSRTGNGKHTNRYFISGSQSTENWYHWKGFLIYHWEHLCLPSHSTGVKENTIMLGLPHKRTSFFLRGDTGWQVGQGQCGERLK